MRNELKGVENELSAVGRMRGAAVQQLLAEEDDLTAARDAVVTARSEYAAQAVSVFQSDLAKVTAELQRMWLLGDAIGAALGTSVEMPMPCKVTGGPRESPHPWPPESDPVRLVRADAPNLSPVAVDPSVRRIGEIVAKLDSALAHCSGIRSTLQRERPARDTDDRASV